MSDDVEVRIWQDRGDVWVLAGQVMTFDSLTFEPRYLAAGTWQMSMPFDEQALRINRDRLITIDWRGVRTTWGVEGYDPSENEDRQVTLEVQGMAALSRLGWATAWPNPADRTLTEQPRDKVYTGPTETVVLALIADNLRDRYGMAIDVPASQGRGSTITARARFENLLELVTTKAKVDQLVVDVGLVDVSPGRARLAVQVRTPSDLTKRVQLTTRVGTLRTWKQASAAPTGTRAIVGGAGADADRVFRVVTTPESEAAATAWGGHREVFVDGPTSYDAPELDQAGREELVDAAATETLTAEAAESEGLQAFRDYLWGDRGTGEVVEGETVTDLITAIKVQVDGSGTAVTPTFGDPNADSALLGIAAIVARLRSQLNAQNTRR